MRPTSTGATPFDAASPVRLTYLEEPPREHWSGSEALLPSASGALLAQRYQLEELEPMGAPGHFWRARQLRSRRPVTVQLLDSAIVEDAVLMEAFLHEASLAGAIEHPHVARVLDYGIDYELEGGVPFLVLEPLAGETLESRLQHERRLSLQEVSRVIGHAALGLSALHERGIIHRRLDPAHLVSTDEFASGRFRAGVFTGSSYCSDALELDGGANTLLLFALDEAFRESLALVHKLSHQLSGAAGGRAAQKPQPNERQRAGAGSYQSPEQLLGHGTVDARSDLWSLAVIAFEALTGVPAFAGATLGERLVRVCSGEPSAIPADLALPRGFDAWFQKGVRKLPSERFSCAREMSDSLARLLRG